MTLDHWKHNEAHVTEDERVLAARAAEGDRDAFDHLVRAHYTRIYAVAFHLLGNHEDAEDVTQDCFVRAHGAIGWFRGEGSLGGWFRRIVVHLVRDRYRRDGRRPLSEQVLVETPARAAHEPEREVGQRELSRRLADAIARLPDNLRIAIILRTREELSYEEIGRAAGVTPATARTHVMKARRELMRSFPNAHPRGGKR